MSDELKAEAQAKQEPQVERIKDEVLLVGQVAQQFVQKAIDELKGSEGAAKTAMRRFEEWKGLVRKEYKLGDKDGLSLEDGTIIRQTPKVVPIVNAKA